MKCEELHIHRFKVKLDWLSLNAYVNKKFVQDDVFTKGDLLRVQRSNLGIVLYTYLLMRCQFVVNFHGKFYAHREIPYYYTMYDFIKLALLLSKSNDTEQVFADVYADDLLGEFDCTHVHSNLAMCNGIASMSATIIC
jgi:hypothetical protein